MYVDDDTRLRRIRDAAHEAILASQGRTRADLDSDFVIRRALFSCIAEIGEATSKLTDEARSSLPGLPWQEMIGMRNRIIHGYNRVNRDVVWQTVHEDLPSLLATLEQRLGPPYSAAE